MNIELVRKNHLLAAKLYLPMLLKKAWDSPILRSHGDSTP